MSKSKADRSAQHDQLAGQAGWKRYKTSTSTFLSDCQPRFIKTQNEAAKKDSFVVYFIRARSLVAITYSFLKIGISNNKEIRFDFDSHKFKFSTLSTISCTSRKEALRIESELLKRFEYKKHVPTIKLLSGGNSECFEDEADLENKVIEAFKALGGKVPPKPILKIDPCIHNLLLMLDYSEMNDSELDKLIRGFRGNLKSLGVMVPPFEDLFNHFLKKIRKAGIAQSGRASHS